MKYCIKYNYNSTLKSSTLNLFFQDEFIKIFLHIFPQGYLQVQYARLLIKLKLHLRGKQNFRENFQSKHAE